MKSKVSSRLYLPSLPPSLAPPDWWQQFHNPGWARGERRVAGWLARPVSGENLVRRHFLTFWS